MKKQVSNKYISAERISIFLAGACVGSIATFFFDPVRGNYRKALLRDKGIRLKKTTSQYGGKVVRDLRNRTEGLKSKSQTLISKEEPIQDEVLEARVRSKFGRIISHPKSIYVLAQNGVVTLSGPILRKELRDLLKCVKKVRGVQDVVNQLTVYETNKGISALQGEGPAYLQE